MNYTKNLGMKLRAQGFEFQSSMKNKEVDYEEWQKEGIEVTVDHIMQDAPIVIKMNLGQELDIKGVRTLSELKMLHRLIYGSTKQKINNEEGD